MRLVGHHRSLQQLWDVQIHTDSGLQAHCSMGGPSVPVCLLGLLLGSAPFTQACGLSPF